MKSDYHTRAVMLFVRLNSDRMNYTPLSHRGHRAARLMPQVAECMNRSRPRLTHLGLVAVLFSHWSVEVLAHAMNHAEDMVRIHKGDIRKAHERACEMAYGNVSLRARASMMPTAEVLGAMLKGFV